MRDFDKSVAFALQHETVFAKLHYGDMKFAISENDASDPGRLTKFGIDQRSHPDVDIKNLTVEQAIEIYRTCYWNPAQGDILPYPLNLEHFDSAVNLGLHQAIKLLQRACGANDDGVWGPKTMAAVLNTCKASGSVATALHTADLRRDFYKNLADNKASAMKYLKGWLNRLNDLEVMIKNPL